jgi:uncharacterized protein YifE (UPF0438 family)
MGLSAVLEGKKLQRFELKKLKYADYSLLPNQINLLKKRGYIFQALMDGHAIPISPKQKHFVRMCRDHRVKPTDECEAIWKRYLLAVAEDAKLERLELQLPTTADLVFWHSGCEVI